MFKQIINDQTSSLSQFYPRPPDTTFLAPLTPDQIRKLRLFFCCGSWEVNFWMFSPNGSTLHQNKQIKASAFQARHLPGYGASLRWCGGSVVLCTGSKPSKSHLFGCKIHLFKLWSRAYGPPLHSKNQHDPSSPGPNNSI